MKAQEYLNNPQLIAACGLYCGTCSKYVKEKCPGCKENSKAKWCKIRTCNLDNHFSNCTECSDVSIEECKKLNNTIGKVFKLIFGTDRIASLIYIKNNGAEHYAEKMCKMGQMAIKKGNKIF
jgi:hypothetical protein